MAGTYTGISTDVNSRKDIKVLTATLGDRCGLLGDLTGTLAGLAGLLSGVRSYLQSVKDPKGDGFRCNVRRKEHREPSEPQ